MRGISFTKNTFFRNIIYFSPFLLAIASAFIVRIYFFETYSVTSSSMKPTIFEGDFIIVNKFNKRLERGDIVAFIKGEEVYVKRLIALANENIHMLGVNTYIDGKKLEIKPSLDVKKYGLISYGEMLFEETVSGKIHDVIYLDKNINLDFNKNLNSYFFLGDNRDNSEDSRFWANDEQVKILGKVKMIFFSIDPKNKNLIWKRFFKIIQ